MGVIIYSLNLNISPKLSHGMLECYATELHGFDFVIKEFVINTGRYLCQTLYVKRCFIENGSG